MRHVSFYLGWPVWVIWWEVQVYKEQTPSKWTFCRTHNCSLPMAHILIHKACKMENRWIKNVIVTTIKAPKKLFKDKKKNQKPNQNQPSNQHHYKVLALIMIKLTTYQIKNHVKHINTLCWSSYSHTHMLDAKIPTNTDAGAPTRLQVVSCAIANRIHL